MKFNDLVDLTEEDLLNVQKWQTATSIMIQGKMRTPYTASELQTGDRIKRMVGQIEVFKKELREFEWVQWCYENVSMVHEHDEVLKLFIEKELLGEEAEKSAET